MPFAMAQHSNTSRVIKAIDTVVCDSYTWINGVTYTADASEIYINATNDTLFVLNLTVGQSATVTAPATTAGCIYSWNGTTLTESGTYTDTLQTVMGCDSIVTMTLTLTGYNMHYDTVSACGSYTWRSHALIAGGDYYDTVLNDNCGDIYCLHLTLTTLLSRELTVAQCGDYTWYNNTYTTSGDYTHTASNSTNTCDTNWTLHLTINNDSTFKADSACATYTWRNTPYTATGVYVINDTNATTHCVTVNTLDLKIKTPRVSQTDTAVSGCVSARYTFATITGSTVVTFTESGVKDSLFSRRTWANCYDSTVHIVATVYQPSNVEDITTTVCDKYYWEANKVTYTKDTVAKYKVGRNIYGCDSNLVLNLTVKESPVIESINGEWNLNAGDTAHLTATCTEGVSYLWKYGNQTSTAEELVIPNVEGNIDVTLTISKAYSNITCQDTSWITISAYVGINGVEGANVSLYPNPTVGKLNIESVEAINEVVIYNVMGQKVSTAFNMGYKSTVDLSNLSNGNYTMQIVLQNGNVITRKFVLSK